jgi:hypothetical protein
MSTRLLCFSVVVVVGLAVVLLFETKITCGVWCPAPAKPPATAAAASAEKDVSTDGGASAGVIVGVIFGLMAVGLLPVLVFFAYRRKDDKNQDNALHESLLDNDGLEMSVAQPISHQSSSTSAASNTSALEASESETRQSGQSKSEIAVAAGAAAPRIETYRIRLGFEIALRAAPGLSAETGSVLLQGSMFEVDQKVPSATDNQVFLHAVDAGWVGQYHPRSGQPICERAWSMGRSEVDFDMLKHATNNFEASREIGHGGSCTVYQATVDAIPCAIKVLAADAAGWEAEQFTAEVNLLRRVHHPNLCRLYASSTNGPSKCLVLELMEGGALDNRLVAQPRLGWQQRVLVALDTCRGLVYLHSLSPPMIHRDVSVLAMDLHAIFVCNFCFALVCNFPFLLFFRLHTYARSRARTSCWSVTKAASSTILRQPRWQTLVLSVLTTAQQERGGCVSHDR